MKQVKRQAWRPVAAPVSLCLALVGEAPAAGRQPFVARYAHGGLSSGREAADFWLTRGFPLLKSRLLAQL